MFGYGSTGVTTVSSGKSNGRGFWDHLDSGKIVLTGKNNKGQNFKRTAVIRAGEVWDNKLEVE